MSVAATEKLQRELNLHLRRHGRAPIRVDGQPGPRTAQAVHVLKYLLGFPTSRLDTGATGYFRKVLAHPALRPPTYLARASARAKYLAAEAKAASVAPNHAGDFGIDYAWGTPVIEQLTKAGVRFVCRYLSPGANPKNLTRNEALRLSAAGITIVVVWESTATRALQGRAAGVADATAALAELRSIGAQPAGIYFAVDFDSTPAQAVAIAAYFAGVRQVIGGARTGVYGGYYTVKRLLDARDVALAWQTYAWSGGHWDPRAHLQQYSNGHTLAGVSCDYDRATEAAFGQFKVR